MSDSLKSVEEYCLFRNEGLFVEPMENIRALVESSDLHDIMVSAMAVAAWTRQKAAELPVDKISAILGDFALLLCFIKAQRKV